MFIPVQTTPVDKAGPHEENKPSVLSHSSQVIKVQAAKEYSIRAKKDKETCCISGVCEIATGKVLISDSLNKRVKLLDHNYTVDAYCDMPGLPLSMCSIDSSLVAVALRFDGIHFVRLTNGQLTKDKTLQLEHDLSGLTYHHGNLYVTSGAALFHYTVDGRLVSKLYEVTAETMPSCAVSADGERIYLVCYGPNQLVTLSKNGTVISIMKEPSLDWGDQLAFHGLHVTEMGSLDSGDKLLLHGLHVTEMGQVLVCGFVSNKIIQVDRDGRQRLAEVVTEKDDVDRPIPVSVYYSKHTGTLIVGMLENDSIFVFTTQ
ncbi:uncharacterized protein LOC127880590 [Dreissena polymorpha]|uniref:uncharacterized protein LOC127880590 n=1 Tax=Dreissena polymorpha TaxID=45954 RepID=UPI002263B25F|nr:uncharacterized protein LOC127880590 [Dreissena polymorpha]